MLNTVTVLPMTSTQAGNLLQNAESSKGSSVTLHATFPDASDPGSLQASLCHHASNVDLYLSLRTDLAIVSPTV